MLVNLSLEFICSCRLTVLLELVLRKQIVSAAKCASMFMGQIEAIVYKFKHL